MVEFCFYLHYCYKSKRLQQRVFRAPPPPGQSLRKAREVLAAIDVIKQGRGRLDPSMRSNSLSDLTRSLSHDARDGSDSSLSLETLLRREDSVALSLAHVSEEQEQHYRTASDASATPESLQSAEDDLLSLKHAEFSGWFLGADVRTIRRGNVVEWTAWAFFDTTENWLTATQVMVQL
jgi:hypothetical protein